MVPLANDEAYYWDWGRALQLSYYDHPPGVSWLAVAGNWLGGLVARGLSWGLDGEQSALGLLSVRAVIPILHCLGTLIVLAIVGRIGRERIDATSASAVLHRVMVLTQLAPVVSLGGIFLMPDAGLLVAVSFVAWMVLSKLLPEEKKSPPFARGPGLSAGDGIALGVLCGSAGLFKYHAVALCGGLIFALIWLRRTELASDKYFWIATILTGFLMCTPVWVWNLQHQMASFSFQASHGFGGLHFQPLFAARLLLGLIVFFSPYLFWHLIASPLARVIQIRTWSGLTSGEAVLIAGAFPLMAIIIALAPFKQILPHWLVPSMWLLIPLAALRQPRWPRLWSMNALFAGAFSLVLAICVGVPYVRNMVITGTNNRPGGLGEMTVWSPLVSDLRVAELAHTAARLAAPDRETCPKPFAWASMRWYSVAQLAFALPGRPKVWSMETGRYYYHFRDQLTDLAGCTVLAIGETGHYDSRWFGDHFNKFQSGEIVVQGHDDRPFAWTIGKYVP